MYFTYVVRPGEAPEGRGPQFEPFWDFLISYNLRLGFLLQFSGYIGLLTCVAAGGKDPLSLLSVFRARPEALGDTPFWGVMLSCAAWLTGILLIMAFLQLADDDSSIKQSRGYRAGIKFLLQATSLGAVSWTISLVSFYAANSYFDDPWMRQAIAAGSDWMMFFSGRLCDSFSLLMFSGAVFFLEAYHAEGAGEAWAWVNAFAFKFAAIAEIVGLTMFDTDGFKVVDAVYTVLLGVALCLTMLWSFVFEPISHRYDVKLTQSAMRNEFYKSRNAMAYYGPAVVNANGEIDISQAAEQAQACLSCNC